MSQASELLNSVTEAAAGTATEGNIVIGRDRYIVVPDSLKKIGVQYDHDVETVTFDCPRYWDDWDLSTMRIYINYMRADGGLGMHLCSNVKVDDSDSETVHFDWTISGHVTEVAGQLSFLVCIKNVEIDGIEKTHWNSELNTEMYISAGLKCKETILRKYPDIISQLLLRMETAETNLQTWIAETEKEIADWEAALKKDINTWETNTYNKMDSRMKTAESNTTPAEILRRINNALDTNAETQQQIYDAASDYLRDGIVATGKIEEETNAYLEENLAIIADDLLDITLENTIEKSGVVIPSGEGNMLPVKIMGDSYQKQMSGKNLLDLSGFTSGSNNGITIINNGDGSCTLTGTPTESAGNVWLDGGYMWAPKDDGSNVLLTLKAGKTYLVQDCSLFSVRADGSLYAINSMGYWINTLNEDFKVTGIRNPLLNEGQTYNTTIYPMVAESDVRIPWEPYCGGQPSPNPDFPQEIENVGVVRNLLDCSGLVEKTDCGITFTPVFDENGLLEYVEVDGTASELIQIPMCDVQDNKYRGCILSGCPSNGTSTSYRLQLIYLDNSNNYQAVEYDWGTGVTLNGDYPKCRTQIRIEKGYTANKLKFYPMIRPASIADPTYHPYIPENKENLLRYPYANSTKTEKGVTFTDNGDGSIKFVGTSTGYSTFTLNTDWKPVPGNYKKNVGKKCDFKISRYKRSSNSYDAIVVENNITVFDTSDWDFETYIYRPLIQISSSLGAVDDTFYPRLVKNHIPAQGSQYEVEVKSVGKNLLKNTATTKTVDGVNFTVNEDGSITVDGAVNTSATNARLHICNWYPSDATQSYILSGGDNANNVKTYVCMDKNNDGNRYEVSTEKGVAEFIPDADAEYYSVYLRIASGQTISNLTFYPMIRPVGTDSTYEPYCEHSTTIHLDEPLRGIGEYRDTICQKDGVWGVERWFEEVVFDGSDDEDINIQSCKLWYSNRALNTKAKETVFLCDQYRNLGHSENVNLNSYINSQKLPVFYDPRFADISEVKAMLRGNPVSFEYKLAEPTFTPFEDQKQFWKMMAFDGATTISIIDGSDNTVPVGVFRVGRNQDGGKLLTHHSTLNNIEDLEGKITPIPILQADYDKLPESKKKNGIYIITDANVTSFTGNTVRYTGGREGLGDTVDKAISTIDERLTASNGTSFRFGVNNEGEYGYIVTDSEGADTFYPFKNLERDTAATAAAAQITEGYTAWVNGKLIVGTRPAAPKTLSGEFYRGIGEGVATYKYQIDFSPAFDVIPEFTYNIQLGNNDTTGQLLYVKRDHAMFQIVHSKGNESSSVRITWTATVQ